MSLVESLRLDVTRQKSETEDWEGKAGKCVMRSEVF
jgi:hypothetical protein